MSMENNTTSFELASESNLNPPKITDLSQLTDLREVHDEDDNGDMRFHCTKFTLHDEGQFAAWIGYAKTPKHQLTPEIVARSLERLPEDEIYPLATEDMPLIPASEYVPSANTWLKGLNLQSYNLTAGTSFIANQVLEEVRVYQLLRDNPHPNLADMQGCLEKNNRVVGILLRQYSMTLKARMDAGQKPFDRKACLECIQSALEHLHSLGFAHNDINPANVMFDEHDTPVVIDMGSSRQLGWRLSQMGTPGWNEGFERFSSFKNDHIGLQKLKKWLLGEESSMTPNSTTGLLQARDPSKREQQEDPMGKCSMRQDAAGEEEFKEDSSGPRLAQPLIGLSSGVYAESE